jgi:hypothetical protein
MCNSGVVKCNKSKMCFLVWRCENIHPKRNFDEKGEDIDSVPN